MTLLVLSELNHFSFDNHLKFDIKLSIEMMQKHDSARLF